MPKPVLAVLLLMGFFTATAFVAKTLIVLLQTFILPGKSVRHPCQQTLSHPLKLVAQVRKYASKDGSWAGESAISNYHTRNGALML